MSARTDIISALQAAGASSQEVDESIQKYRFRNQVTRHVHSGEIINCREYTKSVDEALSLLPYRWWLEHACEDRSPIRFAGDRHNPVGTYTVRVQHQDGGRLREARGSTLAIAICIAAFYAMYDGESAP